MVIQSGPKKLFVRATKDQLVLALFGVSPIGHI